MMMLHLHVMCVGRKWEMILDDTSIARLWLHKAFRFQWPRIPQSHPLSFRVHHEYEFYVSYQYSFRGWSNSFHIPMLICTCYVATRKTDFTAMVLYPMCASNQYIVCIQCLLQNLNEAPLSKQVIGWCKVLYPMCALLPCFFSRSNDDIKKAP